MKQFANKVKRVLIVIAVLSILVFISSIFEHLYMPDMETAIKWKMKFEQKSKRRPITEIITIEGEEGIVYLGKDDRNVIYSFNFDVKLSNGERLYRVSHEERMGAAENNMVVIPTAYNGSTEEIIYGTGRKLARECTAKTGKEATFISFEHDGDQYELWYIMSPSGLPELPHVIMNGTSFNKRLSEETHLVIMAIVTLAVVGIAVVIIASEKFI